MTIHQKLRLRVEPDQEAPFESTVKQIFNDSFGWHIPEEGYSVAVIYDPEDHSKLVIDLEVMPVPPGVDRDEAAARHERTMAQSQDPEALRARMEEIRARAASQMQSAAAMQEMMVKQVSQSRSATPGPDVADELAKLADLRDRGALTDAEFEVQKARLLGAG
jgi:hypothetical protein